MGAKVFTSHTRRNHRINRLRSGEGPGQRLGVRQVTNKRFSTFRNERLQILRVSTDDPNLLTFSEQSSRRNISGVAGRSGNNVHSSLLRLNTLSYLILH